jgi:hypothetical protein
VSDHGQAEGLGLGRVQLPEVEGLTLLLAHYVVSRGLDQAALPVPIADEGIQGIDGQDVVEAVRVLRDAPVRVGHRALAVGGELSRQLDDRRRLDAADLRPLVDGPGGRRLVQQPQSALHLQAADLTDD